MKFLSTDRGTTKFYCGSEIATTFVQNRGGNDAFAINSLGEPPFKWLILQPLPIIRCLEAWKKISWAMLKRGLKLKNNALQGSYSGTLGTLANRQCVKKHADGFWRVESSDSGDIYDRRSTRGRVMPFQGFKRMREVAREQAKQ